MLPWQRAPDNATSKYRNNSTLAKNDFGRLFLSRAHLGIAIIHDSPERHPRGGKLWYGFAFTVLIARNLVC